MSLGSGRLQFSGDEIRDLLVAWLALGVAFAIFFEGGGNRFVAAVSGGGAGQLIVVSLLTAGVAFLLHELGHKVTAVRYGQIAEFRADYGMLFLAVVSATIGFLFAAPGAVHHRGRLTERQHGLIALAGPVVNLVLSAVFLPIWIGGILAGADLLTLIGGRGLAINLFLAGFNMIPFGPLDGKTVLSWSKAVFAVTFVVSVGLAVLVVFVFGIGF